MFRKSILALRHYVRRITFLRKKSKNNPVIPEDNVLDNPYLQSKLLWNDLYGDIEKKWQRSRYLNLFCIGLISVALFSFIRLANHVYIQPIPFIIHGDEIITLDQSIGDMPSIKTRLAPYFAKQFIRAWRSVSTDGVVNQQNQMVSYAFVSNAAAHRLHDFYEQEAAQLSDNITKTITITSVLVLSPEAMDIRWQEETRQSDTGKSIQTQHYIAQLIVNYSTPANNKTILRINPLGFYITQLSWSLESQ